jgi:putative tricarboxylic transport membrane protein
MARENPPLARAPETSPVPVPELGALFVAFAEMPLSGFGLGLVWARRAIVEQHRRMTPDEFGDPRAVPFPAGAEHRQPKDGVRRALSRHTVAIAQSSPGPNVPIVTLIGYQVAGVAGALVATLAMCGPTAVPAYAVSKVLGRSSGSQWPAIVQAALVRRHSGFHWRCASSDLQGMRGFSFGAGTAPRMFAVLLLGLGVLLAATGVVRDGEAMTQFHWRGPLFVALSILTFAVTIRPLGLIVSAFTSFLIAALGTPETRWGETIIVGVGLTAFCSLLFPYALGLPLQLLPSFLIR